MPLLATCVLAFLSVLLAFAITLGIIYVATIFLACLAPVVGGGWVVYQVWHNPELTANEIAVLASVAGSAAALTTVDCLALHQGIRQFGK